MINKMEKNFIKVRTIKDIIISLSLIITGAVISFAFNGIGVVFGGYLLIILGIVLAFVLKRAYKESESGELYLKRELSFQQKMKPTIIAALKSEPNTINISENGNGQDLRLVIFYSKSTQKAYIQLLEYIPFQYSPCTSMGEYEIAQIKNLIK